MDNIAAWMGLSFQHVAGTPMKIDVLRGTDIGLQPGDLIHEINGKSVFSADDLRTLAAQLQSGDSIALLVERAGRWSYLAFDMK